jgi:transcriptional regulator with XRE-family HTH domain
MESRFGARLRQHRERQGIALATVAEKTKIKLSLLEGLEQGNLSHWPVGLFRRAYVRSYAQAIGLDPDAVVRDVNELFPEPVEPVEPPPPPRGLRGFVGVAAGTLGFRRRVEEPPPAPPKAPARDEAPRPIDVLTVPQGSPAPAPVPSPAIAAPSAPAIVAPPAPTAAPPVAASRFDVDLLAAARVCTELGRASTASEVEPLLRDVAKILEARGLIVWLWDAFASELRPALACGYSSRVLAQLPGLPPDADNVTAAAFRSSQTFAVNGSGESSGALAVPLLTPSGCAGVLAIELPNGREEAGTVRAVAMFFAAILAQLFGADAGPAASVPARSDATDPACPTGPISRSSSR